MAVRTCLLCGKSLGRIRGGAGDDFCSREHRNQYRLRRGMERLAEANQVASVIRRRESARQIPVELLRAPGNVSTRDFAESLRAEIRPSDFRVPRPAPAAAGMSPSSEFVRPVADCAAEPIVLPGEMVSPCGATSLHVSMAAALNAHVEPAPPANAEPATQQIASRRRAAMAPKHKASAAVAPVVKVPPPEVHFAGPRAVGAAAKGRALRVSLSAGFRVPEWKLRAVTSAHPPVAGIAWPGIRTVDGAAPAQSTPMTGAVAIAHPEMRIPAAPPVEFDSHFRWPGAIHVSIQFVDAANGRRTAFVPFGYPEERK